MLNCFKKVRECRNKRKRAAAKEELRAKAGNIAEDEKDDTGGRQAKRPRYEDGRPVVLYVLDLADATNYDPQLNDWHWDLPSIKKLAVIYDSLINDFHVKVSTHLLDGRKVREIIGTLANPQPYNAGVVPPKQTQSETTYIRSDKDLDVFLQLTDAQPIKLLIILHMLVQDGPNTPPLSGTNANTFYFPLSHFDGPEYYVDSLGDSDAKVRVRVGGKRGVLLEDHKFEERLEDLWHRIRRQENLLTKLERKHKALFEACSPRCRYR